MLKPVCQYIPPEQRFHVGFFRISKPFFITQKILKNGKWEVGNENAGHENAYSALSACLAPDRFGEKSGRLPPSQEKSLQGPPMPSHLLLPQTLMNLIDFHESGGAIPRMKLHDESALLDSWGAKTGQVPVGNRAPTARTAMATPLILIQIVIVKGEQGTGAGWKLYTNG